MPTEFEVLADRLDDIERLLRRILEVLGDHARTREKESKDDLRVQGG